MKIALLFQDKGISGMDLSDVTAGNPGMGGTEYLFVLLCHYLADYSDIEVTVYHFNDNKLPSCRDIIVKSEEEAFSHAAKEGDNIFIMKNLQTDGVYDLLSRYKLKYVIWCHNFLTYNELQLFHLEKNVKRVIAVGRQMYDYYIDDKIVSKLDFVSNLFMKKDDERRTDKYKCDVTYVGSLIYQKSFHVLANAWKAVVKEVPEARLNVIGTGKLYDRDARLGKLGIAEESYEEMFLENLRDDNGNVLDSVIFHGLLGEEKKNIYMNTAVGVVNPMASTETFCLCAIEMEAYGIPVVSRRKNGLLDTVVPDETGLLYKDSNELAAYIIKLLKERELNDRLGENAFEYAKNAYTPEKVMPEWIRVLSEVEAGKKATYKKPVNYFDNNGKRIRMILHAVHSCPVFKFVPSVHDIQKK